MAKHDFNQQANFDLDRLTNGIRLNSLNKPYTLIYIDKLITYFEKSEEYEKCGSLLKVKNKILNHDNNYY